MMDNGSVAELPAVNRMRLGEPNQIVESEGLDRLESRGPEENGEN